MSGGEGIAPSGKGRIPCLDGLRGLAILLVCFYHVSFTYDFHPPAWIHLLARRGEIGVDLFFSLSGFLITFLLLKEQDQTGRISVSAFYVRRALRILPAYLLFLLLLGVLAQSRWLKVDPIEWAAAATWTANLLEDPRWATAHLWSLSQEEQFYLLWPPLLVWLGRRRMLGMMLCLLLLLPLIRIGLWWQGSEWGWLLTDRSPVKRLDSLVAGCLLALATADPRSRSAFQIPPLLAAALTGVFLILLGTAPKLSDNSLYNLAFGHTLTAVSMSGLLWLAISYPRSLPARLLQLRPLVGLGTISYGLYLWQQWLLWPGRPPWFTSWPNNLVLAICAATLSYLLIEKPFLKLKSR